MQLDDIVISRAIVERYFDKLLGHLDIDVALVGAGPSNLLCATLLGEAGIRAAVFESKLAPGGGMWGGGMMFNEIVVQREAVRLLDHLGIRRHEYQPGYFVADSVEATATLISSAVRTGVPIFNLVKVEDVMFRGEGDGKRIDGLVLNWSPVTHMGLHVDPLTIRAKAVVDGTGHPSEICSIVTRKMDVRLNTPTGKVVGEMSMWAERGEELTLANSVEVFPGLFVAGMAANAVMGAPRMGPVFGGMLRSGEEIAGKLIERFK